jgi:molybdenum ABC transporter, periplasmic molybdate-binding protein
MLRPGRFRRTSFGKTAATVLCAAMFTMAGCGNSSSGEKTELLVSAAASLTDALQDIKAKYEESRPHATVSLNFGASGALRRQIEQGAAADLFFSADGENMRRLTDKRLIDASGQTALLSNELVVIVPADSGIRIDSIGRLLQEDIRHIAIGDPATVPSGAYAREALERLGLWESVRPLAVYGNNVRQVLAYVETGNADAGFVYNTDALASDRVRTALTADPAGHSPILYYVGILNESKHRDEAEAFYRYLQGPEAREIFRRHGFGVPEP